MDSSPRRSLPVVKDGCDSDGAASSPVLDASTAAELNVILADIIGEVAVSGEIGEAEDVPVEN